MRAQFIKIWEDVRSSYWFVPLVMAVGAMLLSSLMLYLDEHTPFGLKEEIGFIWSGGADSARDLLSTITGSMITVTGVIFSITIVALSQASAQLGPRLLRNFMRDTSNQVALGTFIATFIYCLLILRTIRSNNGDEFVPHLSITVAILTVLLSLGVLIYFIHHVSLSIQAPILIATVAHDLFATIERLFPAGLGESTPEHREADIPTERLAEIERDTCPIVADDSGYLQVIDSQALMETAVEHDLLIVVKYRPGQFVIQEKALVFVSPIENVNDELAQKITRMFILGRERTHTQDVEFAINQMVEVAVRSLSTGINDPFTAMNCIDWLGAGLVRLAGASFPSRYRYDEAGNLRVVVENPETFTGMTAVAFDQIRQNARSSTAVHIRMLETIAVIITHAHNEEDRQALLRQAEMIRRDSEREIPEKADRQDVEERYQAVLKAQKESIEQG